MIFVKNKRRDAMKIGKICKKILARFKELKLWWMIVIKAQRRERQTLHSI